MNTLTFQATEIRPLVQHAFDCKLHRPTYKQRIEFYGDGRFQPRPDELTKSPPGLALVHDQGIYLMSNGLPPLLTPGSDNSQTAYARGCNPHVDADWWERSRDLVGGDDFAEYIGIEDPAILLDPSISLVTITVTAETFVIETSGDQ